MTASRASNGARSVLVPRGSGLHLPPLSKSTQPLMSKTLPPTAISTTTLELRRSTTRRCTLPTRGRGREWLRSPPERSPSRSVPVLPRSRKAMRATTTKPPLQNMSGHRNLDHQLSPRRFDNLRRHMRRQQSRHLAGRNGPSIRAQRSPPRGYKLCLHQ